MKIKTKILAAAAVTIATATAVPAVAPAQADASYGNWKSCSGVTSGVTRGGYSVVLSSFRGWKMNCSSVRYAARHLRKRMTRTWAGWPNVSFYDGYVTWHCGAFDNGGIKCWEYSSNTAFKLYRY